MTQTERVAAPDVAPPTAEQHLSRDEAEGALQLMAGARALVEGLATVRRQAKVPARPDAVNREALEVGMGLALGPSDGLFAPSRYLAAHLARGVPTHRLLAIARGDAELARKVPRGAPSTSIGASATVPDLVPMAVGAAVAAHALDKDRVIVAPCDRESLAAAYPELRLARDWRLPFVLVLDDRAEGDPFAAGEAVAGLTVEAVPAVDVEAVFGAVRRALARSHAGDGPVCVACRDIAVQEGSRHKRFRPLDRRLVTDPVALLVSRLSAHGFSRTEIAGIRAQAVREVAATFELGAESHSRAADPLLDPSAGVLEVRSA